MEEIDLKELISMFLDRKFLIIFVVLVAIIMGALYTSKLIVPEYQSTTSLILVQVAADNSGDDLNSITSSDIALNSNLVDDYREIAKSKSVVNKVISNLNLDIPLTDLQNNIAVTSVSNTEVIQITVTNTDPDLASKLANELAKVFIEKVDDIYKVSNVHVLDAAEKASEPSNVHLFKNVVVFGFVGLILVSAYILLINMLDTTVKTDLDIEKALGVPVLASIMLNDDSNKKKSKIVMSEENIQISPSDINLDTNPKSSRHHQKGGKN